MDSSHSLVERKKEEEDWKKKSLATPSSRAKAPLLFRPPDPTKSACLCVYIYIPIRDSNSVERFSRGHFFPKKKNPEKEKEKEKKRKKKKRGKKERERERERPF